MIGIQKLIYDTLKKDIEDVFLYANESPEPLICTVEDEFLKQTMKIKGIDADGNARCELEVECKVPLEKIYITGEIKV